MPLLKEDPKYVIIDMSCRRCTKQQGLSILTEFAQGTGLENITYGPRAEGIHRVPLTAVFAREPERYNAIP